MKYNLQKFLLAVGLGLTASCLDNLSCVAMDGHEIAIPAIPSSESSNNANVENNDKPDERKVTLHRLSEEAQDILPGVSRELLIVTIAEKMVIAANTNSRGEVEEAYEGLDIVKAGVRILGIDDAVIGKFHPPTSEFIQNEVHTIAYLIHERNTGHKLGIELEKRFGKQDAAIYEFTIKAFLAMKFYVPNSDDESEVLQGALIAMERSAATAGISKDLYADLVRKFKDGRESYRDVFDTFVECIENVKMSLRFPAQTSPSR